MTITLGGISLPDDLVLEGIENAPDVAWSSRRTLGGRAVIQIGPTLNSGREIALQSENHLSLSQVAAVKAIAGQTVALIHPRGAFSVVITGVSDMEPDQQLVNPADATNQWWSGRINMIEV